MSKRKSIKIEQLPVAPEQLNPQTPAEFAQRAWMYYSRGLHDLAEADYRVALEADPENTDIVYGMALTLKSSGSATKALEYFEKAAALAENIENKQRAQILVRLIRGQINQIRTGDWNLMKEIWKKAE